MTTGERRTFERTSIKKFAIARAQKTAMPEASLPIASAISLASFIKKAAHPRRNTPVFTTGQRRAAVITATYSLTLRRSLYENFSYKRT